MIAHMSRIRLGAILAVVIALAALSQPLAAAAAQAAQPKQSSGPVIAEPANVDLGFIAPRSTVRRDVTLVNTLDRPVRILAAEPTCTCTSVDLKGKVIPARGTLSFPIQMHVSASTGTKFAEVQIALDGVPEILKVSLTGEISYPIRATSIDKGGATRPYIDADTDPARVQGTLRVESLNKQPFAVRSVLGQPPVFVGFDPASGPLQNAYELRYDLSRFPCEQMPPYLLIETDRADCRVLDMRVRHTCTHIKAVLPFAEYRGNAGVLVAGQPASVEIGFKKSGDLRVSAVRSLDPRFTAALASQRMDKDGLVATATLTAQADLRGVVMLPLEVTVPTVRGPVTDRFLVYAVIDAPPAPQSASAAP